MKRRDFVLTVAASAGAAYAAMEALDLLEAPATAQTTNGSFRLPHSGNGKRIIILGAGLAGMASAYELGKVGGYDCAILEARSRAGGRSWTIRGGDQFDEINGVTQTAQFDAGLYLNPGPARIPQHHVTLKYCKELGVPLEVRTNLNRNQYYYNENAGPLSGRKIRSREALFDMYGYISELLAKAVNQNAINASLTAEDKAKLVDFLKSWGGLSPDLFYKGTSRRGLAVEESAGLQPGQVGDPFDLSALIQLGFAGYDTSEFAYDQHMTMLQPIGGMDQIAKAFERQVGDKITFSAEVTEIRKLPNGVRVVYKDKTGNVQQVTGDYCICTIPLSVLKSIPADFSPDMQQAISSIAYASTGKSGLQFNRRFWEEDDDIYGGVSYTNQTIGQVWYPSNDFFAQKGVLTGYYNFGGAADAVGKLPPEQRVALAVDQGAKIHPQYRDHFENGVSVYWPNIPYNLGGWVSYTENDRKQYYPRLNEPDGNIYLAGEHMSYITAWQAGALESARLVTSRINALA